jgi:hypothetical protein
MPFCISAARRQLSVATAVAAMWNTVHPNHFDEMNNAAMETT